MGLYPKNKINHIERVSTRSEEEADEVIRQQEQSFGETGSNWNLWYYIHIEGLSNGDILTLINKLNTLDIIEFSEFTPNTNLHSDSLSPPFSWSNVIGTSVATTVCPVAPGNYQSRQGYLDPAPKGIDALGAWGKSNAGKGINIRVKSQFCPLKRIK